jgi:hypothetical protein
VPNAAFWLWTWGTDVEALALVDCHRSALPVLSLDPNPSWMGFYASRPEAKRRASRIVRQLVVAEKLTVLPARTDLASRARSRTMRNSNAATMTKCLGGRMLLGCTLLFWVACYRMARMRSVTGRGYPKAMVWRLMKGCQSPS